MRNLLAFVLMIALVSSAAAADLGNVSRDIKTNDHVGMNPGTPDGRDGGEAMGDAVGIASLPFSDTGNTSGNMDDYDAVCPYSGSTSPDQVYSFTPASDMVVSVDLLGSTYDTKVYVMLADQTVIACNDDFHPGYVSMIQEAYLLGGTEYFVIVDGYGGDMGDFVINILEFEACIIDCGDDEGEPALDPGYMDAWNGGCNSPEYGSPFQSLEGDGNGDLTFCGQSGWYDSSRDTDWFIITVGEYGMVEWTVEAEQGTNIYLLGPNDCDAVGVIESATLTPCVATTLSLQGTPGDLLWLWVGPSEFSGPVNEYNYLCTFTGLFPGTTATEEVSFDGIKSLYR
ncbi:MAG: hypothetical protein GY780_07365 [bacterium]|nr:hypothetical protein [bacterium]